MKLLVVLCAAVACAVAKPGFAYSSIAAPSLVGAHGWVGPALSRTIVGPGIASPVLSAPGLVGTGLVGTGLVGHGLAAPGLTYAAQAYAAPVAHAYAAPAAIAAPAIAAPVVTAPAVAAAPVVAAPAIAHAAVAAPVVAAAPAVTKTQYHAQNELGEASYGHSEPLQAHNAVQDAHGNKVGSFSYLNPHDGQVHRTDYVADAHGYRVAANDLPAAPAVVPVHAIHRRSVVVSHTPLLTQTPGSTALLAHGVAPAAVAAPLAYSAGIAAPVAYSAGIAAPVAYSAGIAAPLAYSAGIAAPLAVAPAAHGIPATLTTITNNPGHAVSYRVD